MWNVSWDDIMTNFCANIQAFLISTGHIFRWWHHRQSLNCTQNFSFLVQIWFVWKKCPYIKSPCVTALFFQISRLWLAMSSTVLWSDQDHAETWWRRKIPTILGNLPQTWISSTFEVVEIFVEEVEGVEIAEESCWAFWKLTKTSIKLVHVFWSEFSWVQNNQNKSHGQNLRKIQSDEQDCYHCLFQWKLQSFFLAYKFKDAKKLVINLEFFTRSFSSSCMFDI